MTKLRLDRPLHVLSAVAVLALVLPVFAAGQLCVRDGRADFATDPETGQCRIFPDCGAPAGWEPCPGPVGEPDPGSALVAPAPAPTGGGVCAQVITFAEDPRTGECVAFPTPCDVPKGWKSCGPGPVSLAAGGERPTPALAVDPLASAEERGGGNCIQVITYARDPETGVCTMFPTPCDVPKGWESCQGSSGPTEPI